MSTKLAFDSKQISQMLPHKYPFLLMDRAYDVIPGQSGYGVKSVTANEWYFQGHFPGEPIVPGVLIIESMAQLTAIIYTSKLLDGNSDLQATMQRMSERVGYLVKTDIKFLKPVHPGCLLVLYSELVRAMGALSQVRVSAKVEGQTIAEGTLSVSERNV